MALLPQEHGLRNNDVKIRPNVIEKIIDGYTKESGVRSLEKNIAKIVRNCAKNIATRDKYDVNIKLEDLKSILGPQKIIRDKYETNGVAGVVTGLAWTQVGGDILFIESIISPGKGKLSITGNIGKVMSESATIALQYIKSNAKRYNLNQEIFDKYNIHIHVPEGAKPKDKPEKFLCSKILNSSPLLKLYPSCILKNDFGNNSTPTITCLNNSLNTPIFSSVIFPSFNIAKENGLSYSTLQQEAEM